MLPITADELALHLREYLPRASAGESIAIVDQGKTVAHLVGEPLLTPALALAVATGAVTLPQSGCRRSDTAHIPPIPGQGHPASRMVVEDRR